MVKAKIKDNKVYCPMCEKQDFRIDHVNYKLYKTPKMGNATLFTCNCSRCNLEFGYFLKLTVKDKIHFIEDLSKCEELK